MKEDSEFYINEAQIQRLKTVLPIVLKSFIGGAVIFCFLEMLGLK
jgi:hypothetical protein